MVKIINIADPHVDATSVGTWDQDKGMHSNWVESFARLNDVVDAANEQKADFLVVDGDLFDTGKPTAEAVGLTVDAFQRLDNTKVILLDGNHDQQGVVASHRTPIAAYFSSLPGIYAVSTPQVLEVDGMKFALAPWLRVAGKSKIKNISDELKAVIERLSEEVGSGPSMFAGHLVVDECTFDNGMENRGSEIGMATTLLEAHIPTALLDEGNWAFARLGHIHKRQQLSEKTGYAGSIYKVSFGEYRDKKGYDIITLEDSNKYTLEFGELDVRNLIKIDLSATGDDSIVDLEKVDRTDIVRIVVDHDGADSLDIKNAKARLDKLGISNHIVRNPKPRQEAQIRQRGAAVDTTPIDALAIYLDRSGITDKSEREMLIEEMSEIMADAGVTKR